VRELLSRRFWAALGGVVCLVAVAIVASAALVPAASVTAPGEPDRRIDRAGVVVAADLDPGWSARAGSTEGRARFTLGDGSTVTVGDGTPGVVTCARPDRAAQCALLIDDLGGAVVWFVLAPLERGAEVTLPGVVAVLDQGREARLDNGWVVPLVDVVTRRGTSTETTSFRDFVARVGADSVAIYDLAVQEVSTVACRAG
jgi:hypothetical protein